MDIISVLNIYDYCVIAFFIVMLVWGNRSGFVNVTYRMLSFIISVFIAVNLYPYVAAILRMTPLYSFFCNHYSASFSEKLADTVSKKTIDFSEGIEALDFPGFIEDWLTNNSLSTSLSDTVGSVATTIGECFAKLLVDIIAVIVLFLVVVILMFVLKKVLTTIVKLPVLKTANRLLGTVLGFVLAIILTYFLSGIIAILSGAFSWNDVSETINTAFLTPYFVEGNFMLSIFN